jgi:hypothetical protein
MAKGVGQLFELKVVKYCAQVITVLLGNRLDLKVDLWVLQL